jgi:hypothetical protein
LDTFVAVVSSTGPISFFGRSAGQHYQQLFSEETGDRVGSPVRIGVGGWDVGPIHGRWVANNRYVIHDAESEDGYFDLICIVDVQDQIGTVGSP